MISRIRIYLKLIAEWIVQMLLAFGCLFILLFLIRLTIILWDHLHA